MHLVLSVPTLPKILGVVDAWVHNMELDDAKAWVLPGYTTHGRTKAWVLPGYNSTKLHHAKAWVPPA